MPQDTAESNGHGLIDQAYDKAEAFVTGIGHALGVDVNVPDPDSDERRRPSAPPAIPAAKAAILPPKQPLALPPVAGTPAAPPPPPGPRPPGPRPFEVIELMIKGAAASVWVVTNGTAAIGCGSAAQADAVISELAKTGAPTVPRGSK